MQMSEKKIEEASKFREGGIYVPPHTARLRCSVECQFV